MVPDMTTLSPSGPPSFTPSGHALLDELQQTVQFVTSTVGDATVAIGRSARGSGVVIGPDRVLTNAHNLRDRTTSVTFADGRSVQGRVIATDAAGDLAVLDVATGDATPLSWAEDAPGIGAAVFAVDQSHRGTRVTFGLVSGVSRRFRGPGGRPIGGAVEHTAVMGRGSSGGPLVDVEGRLVGINTHRLGDGFYLARAVSSELRQRVDHLIEGRSRVTPTLGVAIAPPHVATQLRKAVGLAERDGLLVRGVESGGAGDRAGVREGDLIVGAAGAPVIVTSDLFQALDAVVDGSTFELAIVRGAEELSITVSFDAPATDGADSEEPTAEESADS